MFKVLNILSSMELCLHNNQQLIQVFENILQLIILLYCTQYHKLGLGCVSVKYFVVVDKKHITKCFKQMIKYKRFFYVFIIQFKKYFKDGLYCIKIRANLVTFSYKLHKLELRIVNPQFFLYSFYWQQLIHIK